jgi:hypothetical protein
VSCAAARPAGWDRIVGDQMYCAVPIETVERWAKEDAAQKAQRKARVNDPVVLQGGLIALPADEDRARMERLRAVEDCRTQGSAACSQAGYGPGYSGHGR